MDERTSGPVNTYQSGQWLDLALVRKSEPKWIDQFAGGPVPENKQKSV